MEKKKENRKFEKKYIAIVIALVFVIGLIISFLILNSSIDKNYDETVVEINKSSLNETELNEDSEGEIFGFPISTLMFLVAGYFVWKIFLKD